MTLKMVIKINPSLPLPDSGRETRRMTDGGGYKNKKRKTLNSENGVVFLRLLPPVSGFHYGK
jgi:hypothetical protein